MSKLEPHPFSEMFPPMEGEDFQKLVDDIKANGMHEPIRLYQGMILDGRNRYRAWCRAGRPMIEDQKSMETQT